MMGFEKLSFREVFSLDGNCLIKYDNTRELLLK